MAASAASLTVGKYTLTVYEIYKVGDVPAWTEGIDLLGAFGLDYVVVPHWNNAEGGTHDTRCCFIGEERFMSLESGLSEEIGTIGLDEHTACIIDFSREEVEVRGIGTVLIRRGGLEKVFHAGEKFPVSLLRGTGIMPQDSVKKAVHDRPVSREGSAESDFWKSVQDMERSFHEGIESNTLQAMNALLALDGFIWKSHQGLEDMDAVIQARDLLREMIVLLGTRLASMPGSREECLAPLVEQMLKLREAFRGNRQWKEADAVRECLAVAHIIIEDRADGPVWRISGA